MNKYLRLISSIFICEAVGILGSVFTITSVNSWYQTLNKPFFNPPSWVFGPVWTLLYLLMGIALFLVWGKKKANLKWFWVQLILNFLWSFIFFYLKSPVWAFLEIILLWISVYLTIKSFRKINKTASYLLYPYLFWVSFASILNLALVILNK